MTSTKHHPIKKLILSLPILAIALTFGCMPAVNDNNAPLSFNVSVKIAANNLFKGLQAKAPIIFVTSPLLVIDNIVDSDSGEVTVVNEKIANLIVDEATANFRFFSVERMNTDNILKANYVIVGAISHELNSTTNTTLPHLFLSVVDIKSSMVVAKTDVWIANIDLDFNPTPLYRDSPMFLKDKRIDALIATAKAEAGTLANKEYFDSLETNALLDEASNAYNAGNYQLSLGLFARAAERDDGRTMKTFSGLYQNFYKLGKITEAEEAFDKLVEVGIQNDNLSIKFLFRVDSTAFNGTGEDLNEYSIWLKEIAKNINNSNKCVQIIGHASNSGPFEYNKHLSKSRSLVIQKKMEAAYPGIRKKTKAIGRGFTENIVGTGTNDSRDAIDRRVEFRVMDCDAK